VTAAATTLMLTSPAAGWRSIGVNFVYGFAYSACIGSLGWLILPRVGRYSARIAPVFRWTIVVILTIVIAIVGSLIALALMSAVGFIPWSGFWLGFWHNLRFTIVITIAIGVGVSLFESMRYRLQYEAAQARLSSLESRLHPHFLFNTLNSISALIPEDPAAAERMTERLAALLRFSLDSTDRQTVPLEHELKITTDYLEIEKTRFGPRLNYSIDVPAELMRLEVPPFSLQTLVENSVKYGGGEIRVSARNGKGRVELSVWDSGTGFATLKEIPAGHGLSNLRSRLEAIWGVNATLEFSQENSGANVRISLPMRPAR
jgi:signal transduction histidine kinase